MKLNNYCRFVLIGMYLPSRVMAGIVSMNVADVDDLVENNHRIVPTFYKEIIEYLSRCGVSRSVVAMLPSRGIGLMIFKACRSVILSMACSLPTQIVTASDE